jgi:hypothetical protein
MTPVNYERTPIGEIGFKLIFLLRKCLGISIASEQSRGRALEYG